MLFFENLYERKMDVILIISLKIAAKIEIRKHMFFVLLLLGVVSALYGMFFHCQKMCLHCFLLSIARLIRLHKLYNAFAGRSFMEKELN